MAVLVARVLLAGVFLVAGLAKAADRAGSRRAVADFGVPAVLAAPLGGLLPAAELVVAAALIVGALAWWGSLGALGLLLLFAAGIGFNLARGRHPHCHCFGQLHSAPAGWPALLRNAGLAAVAVLVAGFGRGARELGVLGWFTALPAAGRVAVAGGLVVAALVAGGGWVLVQLMAQQGRLLLRIEALEAGAAAPGGDRQPVAAGPGLPAGVPAPGFILPGLAGEVTGLETLRARGKPVVLVFSDVGCGPCGALLPEIGRWQREHAATVTIALISQGPADAVRAKTDEHQLSDVLVQRDREVAQAYQADGTPSAVLINRDGTVAGPLAHGADAVRALLASTAGRPAPGAVPVAAAASGDGPRPAAGIGELAPDFALPDLAGRTVRLSDFRGRPVLVLFWNPDCGFCQRMLPGLQAWQARPPADSPRLLVVSTRGMTDIQALGLRTPVLLDDEAMSTGMRFGATGTPMAVLIGADGAIASPLAAGGPAVLALAGADEPHPAGLPLVAHSG